MSETTTPAAFTPGPWMVQPTIGTWIQTVGDPYGHGQMHIADLRGWGHLTGLGACGLPDDDAVAIQDANARLIAAAPDLLAACKKLMEHMYSEFGLSGDRWATSVKADAEAAEAAIAKAEGAASSAVRRCG